MSEGGVSHQLYAIRLPFLSAICALVLPRGWPAHRPREIAWTNVSLMAGYRRTLVRHIETGDFSCDSVSSSGRVPEICGSHGGKEVISNKGYIKASRYDSQATHTDSWVIIVYKIVDYIKVRNPEQSQVISADLL